MGKNKSHDKKKSKPVPQETIPDEFKKVIQEFINDVSNSFPEYTSTFIGEFLEKVTEENESSINSSKMEILYNHCKSVYPERFFDIMYKNESMFTNEDLNTEFLPNVDFKLIWNTPDISVSTRETIWKYLQVILFSLISNINDKNSFGDTAKLFEAINEDELKSKLEETFQNMSQMFSGLGENGEMPDLSKLDPESLGKSFGIDMSNIDTSQFPDFEFINNPNSQPSSIDPHGNTTQQELPNPNDVHDHIFKLLNGKIGNLAKEIAEETAKEFEFDFEDLGQQSGENMNMNKVFQKLFKNPGKLMSMVKNVGKKLDDKFKSGDIKESEIMQEASELLNKMKDMPGMNNIGNIFNQMGMGGMAGMAGLGKGGKVNFGALQSHLNQNMKQAKMKERMQTKLEQKKQTQTQETGVLQNNVFTTGEVYEQTPRKVQGGLEGNLDEMLSFIEKGESKGINKKKNKKKN